MSFREEKKLVSFDEGFDYVREILVKEDIDPFIAGVFNNFLRRENEYRGFFSSFDNAMGYVKNGFHLLDDYQLRIKGGELQIKITNKPAREQEADIGAVFFSKDFTLCLHRDKVKVPLEDIQIRAGISNTPFGGSPYVIGRISFLEQDNTLMQSHRIAGRTASEVISDFPMSQRGNIYRNLSKKLLQSR